MFGWLSKPKEEAASAAIDSAERLIGEGHRAEECGELARACELYRQAAAMAPRYAKAHINLGIALEASGDAASAIRSYEQALAADPSNPAANYNLGKLLHLRSESARAAPLLTRALQQRPNFPEARIVLGSVLAAQGKWHEARTELEHALRQRPDDFGALFHYAAVLRALDRSDDAQAVLRRALAIDASNADARAALADLLSTQGDTVGATAELEALLAERPNFAGALYNYGCLLARQMRLEEAESSFRRAIAAEPRHASACRMLGDVLLAQYCSEEGLDEALASYDKALAIKPDIAEALSNRGVAQQELQRYAEALASYDQALEIQPDFAEAQFNQSLCRLLMGDFERGWEQYEWRWKSKDFPSPARNFSQPLWLGKENINGKTILLHAEQGLGDTIQFARYAQAVARKGARVILEVHATLRSLLSNISGVYQVLSRGEPLPEFDFHCPLLSLPLACNTRLHTIPATVPYLRAPEAAVNTWKERLGQGSAVRVGIVWSGRRAHKNDHKRSIALSRLAVLANPRVSLVSLQKELRAEHEQALAANPSITHFGSELRDFADTAALVSLMDLVISVDTSVAHLAGALGKPVWILLPFAPDWRWLLEREDSPWYPSARLFRQPRIGDWDRVIDKLMHDLRIHVEAAAMKHDRQ